MENKMVLDRKTGVVHDYVPTKTQESLPTRKQMKQMLLPKIGDIINDCRVIYVHSGLFRFTAEGMNLPKIGTMFESDGRIFEVDNINQEKKRFNCSFKGFKQNPIEEAPVEVDENLVKMI